MKTLIGLIAITLVSFSCENARSIERSASSQAKEKEKIHEVITNESVAFFGRNYDMWRNTYAQKDYAFQAWSNDDGTFDASVGWANIDKQIGKYISDNPEENSSHPQIERKNMAFKFYGGNAAYVTWDQFNSDKTETMFYHSKEVRLMEKEGDEWKIVMVAAFWDYKNPIPADKLPMIQRMENESRGKDKI